MCSMRKFLTSLGIFLALLAGSLSATTVSTPAAATEIKLIVNRVPITTYDIQRRAAFMRLQNRKGNLNALAEDEMVDQALRLAEATRLKISIPEDQVADAYARFASSNKMTVEQLDGIMAQSGVTKSHFKDFIRSQMSWSQALNARARAEIGGMSEQDVVRRMMQQGGDKPTAVEYMLQQVIFVVPAAERGNLARRKKEAESLRARYSGCENTRSFVKGLIDVTVRDLGRKFGPELPPEWAEQIKQTRVGGATPVRETERGIEFIGICSSREVSDDRVAKMVFQNENAETTEMDALGKKYLAELKEKANIVRR
jgi:peptidyl-prolyl cis-trans isomerase SurA